MTDSAPKAGLIGNLYSGIAVVPPGSIWAQNPIPDYVRSQAADTARVSPRGGQPAMT